jgi:protein SCO1/2
MNAKVALGLLIGALTGAGVAYFAAAPKPPAHPVQQGQVAIGGPFSLVDPAGQRKTEKDFAGKPMLVFFGFTHCPDICPSGLQILTVALNSLGDRAKDLTPVFVSIDPERDTPAVLGEYLKSFHPRIVGLTGSAAEVQAATKTYRVYAQKVPNAANPNDYNVDHSAFFYLMDKDGRYVQHFPHSVDAEKLSQALRAAL